MGTGGRSGESVGAAGMGVHVCNAHALMGRILFALLFSTHAPIPVPPK
jgi:hypothetical protein